ncbi:hypothetical protein J3F83DRAFT_757131, partial [Trichoderma novae-zelandiae]
MMRGWPIASRCVWSGLVWPGLVWSAFSPHLGRGEKTSGCMGPWDLPAQVAIDCDTAAFTGFTGAASTLRGAVAGGRAGCRLPLPRRTAL